MLVISRNSSSSLSVARNALTGATLWPYAGFAGGFSSEFSTRVDIFNVVSGIWTTYAMSMGAYYMSSVAVGSSIVFVGGGNLATASRDAYLFETTTGQFIRQANVLSAARLGAASVSVFGRIGIFAGGNSGNGNTLYRHVDFYNSSSNSWSAVATGLSVGRSMLAGSSTGAIAVFAGGAVNDVSTSVYSTVDIYNALTSVWTTSSLSVARGSLASTCVGVLLLFGGGHISSGVSSSVVDIYDTVSNVFTTASLSSARSHLSAASLGVLAFFVGGNSHSNYNPPFSTVIDIYDSVRNLWSNIASGLSAASCNDVLVTLGSVLLKVGGYNGARLTGPELLSYCSLGILILIYL